MSTFGGKCRKCGAPVTGGHNAKTCGRSNIPTQAEKNTKLAQTTKGTTVPHTNKMNSMSDIVEERQIVAAKEAWQSAIALDDPKNDPSTLVPGMIKDLYPENRVEFCKQAMADLDKKEAETNWVKGKGLNSMQKADRLANMTKGLPDTEKQNIGSEVFSKEDYSDMQNATDWSDQYSPISNLSDDQAHFLSVQKDEAPRMIAAISPVTNDDDLGRLAAEKGDVGTTAMSNIHMPRKTLEMMKENPAKYDPKTVNKALEGKDSAGYVGPECPVSSAGEECPRCIN